MQIWAALKGGKLDDIAACPRGEIRGKQRNFSSTSNKYYLKKLEIAKGE